MTRRRRMSGGRRGGARGGWFIRAGCIVLLGGCGSSSSPSAPATTGSTAAPVGGEAAKPAGQILSDAAAAMRSVRGYHVQGTITGGSTTRISLTIDSPTEFDMKLGQGSGAFEVIEVAGGSYLRANAAFLHARLGSRAATLSGRWLALPQSTASDLAKAAAHFAPATIASCLIESHGTLRHAGTATVAGQPAVVIEDLGDAPGAQPGKLYVAAVGPPYPLRLTGTGHQQAGGKIDICNDGKASNAGGSVDFSQFNATPPIQAPTNAAAPNQVQGA